MRALKPALVEEGYFEDTVDRWIAGADSGKPSQALVGFFCVHVRTELESLSVHMLAQWHYACGIKRGEVGTYTRVTEDVSMGGG